jgi:hypothetical protein
MNWPLRFKTRGFRQRGFLDSEPKLLTRLMEPLAIAPISFAGYVVLFSLHHPVGAGVDKGLTTTSTYMSTLCSLPASTFRILGPLDKFTGNNT